MPETDMFLGFSQNLDCSQNPKKAWFSYIKHINAKYLSDNNRDLDFMIFDVILANEKE